MLKKFSQRIINDKEARENAVKRLKAIGMKPVRNRLPKEELKEQSMYDFVIVDDATFLKHKDEPENKEALKLMLFDADYFSLFPDELPIHNTTIAGMIELINKIDCGELSTTTTVIEADLARIYGAEGYAFAEITDDPEGKQRLKIYLPGITKEKLQELKDAEKNEKRVRIYGELKIYEGAFQMVSRRIEVTDEQTVYILHFKNWIDQLPNPDETPKIESFSPKWQHIGIISNDEKGKGMDDFISQINKTDYRITTSYTNSNGMKANIIADKIMELRNNGCDFICIIRGGGDKYSIFEFSNPVLVNAIIESNRAGIPILTGIAHNSDKPLCCFYSAYDAPTPSILARDLRQFKISLWYLQSGKKTDKELLDIANKRILVLEQERDNLKEQLKQFTSQQPKGIIGAFKLFFTK